MFNIMLNLWPNHFHDCLVVEGFLASENLRAMDSNLWAFSTNLFPVSRVLPRKALITSFRVDLLNWNLALHCWLTLRGTTGSIMGKAQGMCWRDVVHHVTRGLIYGKFLKAQHSENPVFSEQTFWVSFSWD